MLVKLNHEPVLPRNRDLDPMVVQCHLAPRAQAVHSDRKWIRVAPVPTRSPLEVRLCIANVLQWSVALRGQTSCWWNTAADAVTLPPGQRLVRNPNKTHSPSSSALVFMTSCVGTPAPYAARVQAVLAGSVLADCLSIHLRF